MVPGIQYPLGKSRAPEILAPTTRWSTGDYSLCVQWIRNPPAIACIQDLKPAGLVSMDCHPIDGLWYVFWAEARGPFSLSYWRYEYERRYFGGAGSLNYHMNFWHFNSIFSLQTVFFTSHFEQIISTARISSAHTQSSHNFETETARTTDIPKSQWTLYVDL